MRNTRGFTLIELLIVVAIIGIIAAIAIPGLVRARMSGNEAAAIGSLRAINSAQATYSSVTGQGGYAISLAVLAAPCTGSALGFISPDLASDPSIKSGYTVMLAVGTSNAIVAKDCNNVDSNTVYHATAVPLAAGTSGARGFGTGAQGSIFFTVDGTAGPETGGTPIQ